MSDSPPYLKRAAAISTAGAVATAALTVGIAVEIANHLHPAVTAVGGTSSSGRGSTTTSASGSTSTGSSNHLAPAQVGQAPVGGSHGS